MKSLYIILFIFYISYAVEIDGVPFVKQKDELCGPAALSSVFSFYGVNMSQEEIAKSIYSKQLRGSLITDLENFSKSNGFQVITKTSYTEEIKSFIDNKKPVIALLDLGFWVVSKPHYVVIVGYNEDGFIMHTGYEQSKIMGYKEFEERWKKLGNAIIVVYR